MEHLKLLSTVQNIEKNSMKELPRAAGLGEYLNVSARKLSGGNKRKLSLVLALLGSPDVFSSTNHQQALMWLQEEFCGTYLHAFVRVLCCSHHSMEEAVALGDRIAVMVDGSIAASAQGPGCSSSMDLDLC